MSDYIKREDARAAIDKHIDDGSEYNCTEREWYQQGLMEADSAIIKLPSADVVEVVRCKDCKHSEEFFDKGDKLLCWVHDIDIVVDSDGYCNCGEPKEL